MIDHAYHGNKGEQKFLRARKAGETIGLHPITIRRWITSGKIQMVRVGIKAHTLQSEIEHFIGKADARLLVLSACVSGHDQRPDLQHQIERSTLGRRQSGLPAKCLCSATLLAACLLLASGFNSFSSYCVKTEWQQKLSRLPTAELAVAPSTWKRCLPVLALPNRGDPPRHGGESRATVRQIASGISVFRWTGRIDL